MRKAFDWRQQKISPGPSQAKPAVLARSRPSVHKLNHQATTPGEAKGGRVENQSLFLTLGAYLRRYFTATVRSFGQGAVMVSGSPVTGWGRVRVSAWSAGRANQRTLDLVRFQPIVPLQARKQQRPAAIGLSPTAGSPA